MQSEIQEPELPNDAQAALNEATIRLLRELLEGLENGTLCARDIYQVQDFISEEAPPPDAIPTGDGYPPLVGQKFQASATSSVRIGVINLERKTALIEKGLPWRGCQVVRKTAAGYEIVPPVSGSTPADDDKAYSTMQRLGDFLEDNTPDKE